ncbi:AT hook [Geosmithia morbida]|uniref:AT hook n=1 Tax=Geosmithia morbida TaxID=1094350 RepID=A0A9P4YU53_9HYPO|nr:AT hook [Geosmithia morbida]KAF4121738.1 AT hook [Geosmithia morbida]
MDSSPKRVTRARAAAKATEPAVRTTRIVTAAAKARTAPASAAPAAAAPTRSTAAKRKARADDSDDEQDVPQGTRNRKTARTRLRSNTPAEEPPKTTVRGRPAKKQATEASKAQASAAVLPTRTTRAVAARSQPEPARRTTTRSRSSATAATASSAAAAKPPVRKTVKFQDTGKENVAPGAKKEPVATATTTGGIRGRPARRGGSTTAVRSTRKPATQAASKSEDKKEKKKPLSPRKVTQVPMQRANESEDELAGDDNDDNDDEPKPLMMSPIRPPLSSAKSSSASNESVHNEQDDDSTVTINNAILNAPDLGAITFGSPPRRAPALPAKDTMRSPARKIGAIPLPGSALKPAVNITGGASDHISSPSKSAFLHSPAKRPPSPIKALAFPSPSKTQQTPSSVKRSFLHSPAKRAMPGLKPLVENLRREHAAEIIASPQMKPLAVSTPGQGAVKTPSERLLMDGQSGDLHNDEDDIEEGDDDEPFKEPMEKIKFPGRLSAVMPREVDDDVHMEEVKQPVEDVVTDNQASIREDEGEACGEADASSQSLDLVQVADEAGEPVHTEPEVQDEICVDTGDLASSDGSPSAEAVEQHQDPRYQLRRKDLNPCHDMDSEVESETASPAKSHSDTPTRSFSKSNCRRSTIGFTSLTEQFGLWSTTSPTKEPSVGPQAQSVTTPVVEEPSQSHFFDDEMQSRSEPRVYDKTEEEPARGMHDESSSTDEVSWNDEDVAFSQEAEDISRMTPQQADRSFQHQSHDDSLSDASQEYGDENEAPPMMEEPVPVTPERPQRVPAFFPHTTTKVPLKPADNSTPSPLKKQSFSMSRVSSRRTSLGVPNIAATANSLSPSKRRRPRTPRKVSAPPATPSTPMPKTPNTDDDSVSTLGTPGFTRPDLDRNLLRGAVVFVEARTSDGGDASGLFTDLLKQMGARCRKTWNWNPRDSATGDAGSDKIGITHVVYKDGRPQTLEKVRRSRGLVQCVGVSWVLDCERENEWLDEAPYCVDSSLHAHSGRRRKSMEPKVLGNMNGTLYDSGSRSSRRESSAWMHTPSDQDAEEQQDDDDIDWSKYILTPVPKTPAPEAIAKYAAELPETPGNEDDDEDGTCMSPTMEALVTKTCPPPKKMLSVQDMGVSRSLFGRESQDEQVVKRLLAAKRKSLQFAPKIASPLSKTWN